MYVCIYIYIYLSFYIYIYIYTYIYTYIYIDTWPRPSLATSVQAALLRPFFILIIVRPRIFESKFRDHCAKKLDGALRKPTSFVKEFV